MSITKTLAIIKPDAVFTGSVGSIVSYMERWGFRIVQLKVEQLTTERARAFYAEHEGKPFFEKLVRFMTSGPSVVVALENEEAISCWRDVMKKEIRPSYASSNFSERNAVHGSDSPESAARELAFFGFGAKGASSEGWDA